MGTRPSDRNRHGADGRLLPAGLLRTAANRLVARLRDNLRADLERQARQHPIRVRKPHSAGSRTRSCETDVAGLRISVRTFMPRRRKAVAQRITVENRDSSSREVSLAFVLRTPCGQLDEVVDHFFAGRFGGCGNRGPPRAAWCLPGGTRRRFPCKASSRRPRFATRTRCTTGFSSRLANRGRSASSTSWVLKQTRPSRVPRDAA